MAGSIINPVKELKGTAVRPASAYLRPGLLIACLALFTAGVLTVFDDLSSDQAVSIIAAGVVFFILMWFVISSSGSAEMRSRNLVFALWWVLLGSEEVFSYVTEDAEKGNISNGAYSEAMIWIFVIFVFVLYSYKHNQYLRALFTGPYKWVSWFGIVCLLSVSYAEKPAFSMAWIVKLFLAILLLAACNGEIKTRDDLRGFFKVSQWGFAFLVIVPIIRLVSDPAALATGRLFDVGAAPTMMSVDAGLLVLYSLTLMQPGKRFWNSAFVVLGMLVMLLAAGKTGIMGCIFGSVVFFMLQGKFKAAARFLLILLVVGTLVVAFTPLGSYLKFYIGSGQAGTVTGRADVWVAGWQLIKAKIFLGRGFMSSRFLAYKISVAWQPGHLHNGFLEVMYNNGLIGLFVMVMMHFWIIRNLVMVMRAVDRDNPLRQLSVGCFAIYLDILINGLVSRTFGSRPDATFMALFSLVFIGDRLLQAATKKAEVREMPAWQLSTMPAPAH
jgi:O-antigen ligase